MGESQLQTGRETPSNSRYLSNAADITQALKTLRDQRIPLTLRVDGEPHSYNCKLLDVNDDTFLIEDISPRSGMANLRKARKFSIAARGTGVYMFIEDCRVKETGEERGVPFFYIPLPKSMLMQQRRRAARYRLPLRISADGARISLFDDSEGQQRIVGRVIDISAGGCRAEFDLPVPVKIANDMVITTCTITINRLLEIRSEAVVRNCHENKHSKTLICGLELTQMHVTDRRRLEHFIESISKGSDAP